MFILERCLIKGGPLVKEIRQSTATSEIFFFCENLTGKTKYHNNYLVNSKTSHLKCSAKKV